MFPQFPSTRELNMQQEYGLGLGIKQNTGNGILCPERKGGLDNPAGHSILGDR
jgi:hypothetical protein